MKVNLKKLIFFVILFLFFIFINTNNSFAYFMISEYTIDATVNESGDLYVTEEIEYSSNEYKKSVTRKVNIKNEEEKYSASGFELDTISIDGVECIPTAYGTGNSNYDNVYEYIKVDNEHLMKVYLPNKTSTLSSTVVKYSYVLDNVALKHKDTSELCWKFIDDSLEYDVNNLTINITFPQKLNSEDLHIYGYGVEKGSIEKSIKQVKYIISNVDEKQNVEVRVLFDKNMLRNTQKSISGKILNKYEKIEDGIYLEESSINVVDNFITRIAFVVTGVLVIIILYVYLKYDKEYIAENVKYYQNIPYNLSPEILQYIYKGKLANNSVYISILNLIKLGVYRIETEINNVGRHVQKLIYNKENNVKLKKYQKYLVDEINDRMKENRNGELEVPISLLARGINKKVLKNYRINLRKEKEELFGNSVYAPSGVKFFAAALVIIVCLIVAILGFVTKQEVLPASAVMMIFIAFFYSVFFIDIRTDEIVSIIFLIFHGGCFHGAIIAMLVTAGAAPMYIPYFMTFVFFVYTFKIQKLSKEEAQIVEYTKGLKRYMRDYFNSSDESGFDYIELWEEYFIMACALNLNTATMCHLFNYGKYQVTNLGYALSQSSSYMDFEIEVASSLLYFQKKYKSQNYL